MQDSLPVLYSFRRCPYAMRARLALAISGQACELREVVLKAKPAELLSASAKASVPVLVLPSGEVIDQSLDIMNWALRLNDPAQWLPANPAQTANVQALIDDCDLRFKHHLDRYKYPNRYDGADALQYRAAAAAWLQSLEQQLTPEGWLFGPAASLADIAIAPFVRQFAQTDPLWFEQQDWPALQAWLDRIVSSALFDSVMHKYPAWQSETAGPIFPTP
ncbi:MAG: glutathione S-transferase [Polaromonas sp.]|nr:glutathione S-transferase [Polaromonas sp.]